MSAGPENLFGIIRGQQEWVLASVVVPGAIANWFLNDQRAAYAGLTPWFFYPVKPASLRREVRAPQVLDRTVYFTDISPLGTHLPVPLEELQAGAKLAYPMVATSRDDAQVTVITGDENRLHIDGEYARQTMFGGTIFHGVTTLLGLVRMSNSLMSQGGRVSLREFRISFRGPVKSNGSLTTTLNIREPYNGTGTAILDGDCTGPNGNIALYSGVKFAARGLREPARRIWLPQHREVEENVFLYRKPGIEGQAGEPGDYETEVLDPIQLQPGSTFTLQRQLTPGLEARVNDVTRNYRWANWGWLSLGTVSAELASLGGQNGEKATIVFSSLLAENIDDYAAQPGDLLTARLELLSVDRGKRSLEFAYSVRNQLKKLVVGGKAKVYAMQFPFLKAA